MYQTQYTTEQLLVAHRMGDCLTYPSIGALAADLRNHLVETLAQAEAQLATRTAERDALQQEIAAIQAGLRREDTDLATGDIVADFGVFFDHHQQRESDNQRLTAVLAEAEEEGRLLASRTIYWHDRASAAEAQLAALTAAVETVVTTFQRDEAQGFHSKDRQFAIDMLSNALTAEGVRLREQLEEKNKKDLETL